MKRTLAVLLAICLLTGMLAIGVSAEELPKSGTCGDNLSWVLDGNTLTISGTGPMYDYSEENPSPWTASNRRIYFIMLEDGVTSIGENAFAGVENISRVYIPESVREVGSKAFGATDSGGGIVHFLRDAPIIADDAFLGRRITCVYYLDWDASACQNYGGSLTWVKGRIYIASNSKRLYQLNEEIKGEDFSVLAISDRSTNPITYTPREIVIGAYDNSTYGQKTVEINVDGYEFVHSYYVTDGQNHLELINVELPAYTYYTGAPVVEKPVVTAGNLDLVFVTHYDLAYENNKNVGTQAQVTVTGRDIYEGFERTYSYAILKGDLSNAEVKVEKAEFLGMPVTPKVTVTLNGRILTEGTDYSVAYENNVNIGTGTVRIVGKGGFCGIATKEFEIEYGETTVALPGAENGKITGTLNDELYYFESLLPTGKFIGKIDSKYKHVAYYELYRIDEAGLTLITSKESSYGIANQTKFEYDFSSVYTDAAQVGGAAYMLAYTWADSMEYIYSGACVLYVPAKVSDATSMVVEKLEEDGDFRREYLTAYGLDGNVGDVEWTSSDSSVAAVKDGVVTLKKPGTVTITGQYGGLTASQVIQVAQQDLAQGEILRYDAQTGKADVFYDGYLLTAGTDYLLSASVQEGVTEVTVTGIGLFGGQLLRQFDAVSGEALDHSHSFDSCEDTTCGTCGFERPAAHLYGEQWTKNETHHWHGCVACGSQADLGQHVFSAGDEKVCDICGPLYVAGDLNGDETVNEDDAIYLLQHVLLPDFFPL